MISLITTIAVIVAPLMNAITDTVIAAASGLTVALVMTTLTATLAAGMSKIAAADITTKTMRCIVTTMSRKPNRTALISKIEKILDSKVQRGSLGFPLARERAIDNVVDHYINNGTDDSDPIEGIYKTLTDEQLAVFYAELLRVS